MNKHRIELFSDGVFAIILTLLVLDLRVPLAHGLGALREVWPSLVVHTGSFVLVGILWLIHQGGLERVTEFTRSAVHLNLVCLFWSTLIPFGARNAAERPLEPFGPSLMAAATGFYILSAVALRLSLHSTVAEAPGGREWVRRRMTNFALLAFADLAAALLSWWAPWIAYAAIAATIVFVLTVSHPADEERRLRRSAEPLSLQEVRKPEREASQVRAP